MAEKITVPAPKLPKQGKQSRYSTKRILMNPHLITDAAKREAVLKAAEQGAEAFAKALATTKPSDYANPRQAGSHGFHFTEIVRRAMPTGLTYGEFKAQAEATEGLDGFSNHMEWNAKRGFFLFI